MPWILAVDIDLIALGSLIVTALTTAAGALATLWIGVKKLSVYFWNYAEPKITKAVEEHIGLVEDVRANVPRVSQTLDALSASQQQLVKTQEMQCETLKQLGDASSRHEELHKTTAVKLDEIIVKISGADLVAKG